jgi:hypothetical protein
MMVNKHEELLFVRSLESSGMYRRVVKLMLNDVSEMLTSSIIMAMTTGATSQTTVNFILAAVRT